MSIYIYPSYIRVLVHPKRPQTKTVCASHRHIYREINCKLGGTEDVIYALRGTTPQALLHTYGAASPKKFEESRGAHQVYASSMALRRVEHD